MTVAIVAIVNEIANAPAPRNMVVIVALVLLIGTLRVGGIGTGIGITADGQGMTTGLRGRRRLLVDIAVVHQIVTDGMIRVHPDTETKGTVIVEMMVWTTSRFPAGVQTKCQMCRSLCWGR